MKRDLYSFNPKKINATKVSADGIFELQLHMPKIINKDANQYTLCIKESSENENLFIHSSFNDEAFAIVGNEFYLNFLKLPKAVDLFYFYFAINNKVSIYLYDMKKTFAGENEILDIIEQWKQSIKTAQACMIQLEDNIDFNIKIGVITENNDVERRKRDLEHILHPEPTSSSVPKFVAHKHIANTADIIAKSKLLKDFDKGKVTINGYTYEYDVRVFDNKEYHMYFNDGVLEK